jgi:hypothetical protein
MNKSFLTTVMENARAKKDADKTVDELTNHYNEAAGKRLVKQVALATVGTVAALTALSIYLNKVEKNLPETDPED